MSTEPPFWTQEEIDYLAWRSRPWLAEWLQQLAEEDSESDPDSYPPSGDDFG